MYGYSTSNLPHLRDPSAAVAQAYPDIEIITRPSRKRPSPSTSNSAAAAAAPAALGPRTGSLEAAALQRAKEWADRRRSLIDQAQRVRDERAQMEEHRLGQQARSHLIKESKLQSPQRGSLDYGEDSIKRVE